MAGLETLSASTLGYAFVGGFLPALLWFYVLLKEDYRHPEPRALLLLAFAAGMASVPLAALLETAFRDYAYAAIAGCAPYAPLCTPIIAVWAVVEEALKYLLVSLLVLWRRDVDEPIDLVIYMITAALGFAALENMLFLLLPLASGDFLAALATGNLRFVGSTVLHIIASSAIGFALAFSCGLSRTWRSIAAAAGLILAIALHAVFNFLIIPRDDSHSILSAFLFVWSGAVVLFGLFEVLKFLQRHAALRLRPSNPSSL